MKPLIVINFCKQSEMESVAAFAKRFGSDFRGVSNLKTAFTSWPVDSMNKIGVEWTKRFLRRFMEETKYDCLIKIDPDTTITGELQFPIQGGDVAGDFRHSKFGWIWFGGYHFFTRAAVERILSDSEYVGSSFLQDIPLTQSVIRMGLKTEQLQSVNCWKLRGDADTAVSHAGRTKIPISLPGLISCKTDGL